MIKLLSKTWFLYLVIIIVGLLVYVQTVGFNFVYLDDNALILDRAKFLASWLNFWPAFKIDVFSSAGSAAYYRPLYTISYLIDFQIGAADPWIYHFTNVIFHLAASLLLFSFLLKLKIKPLFAWILALLFVVHPALVGAVAWIPGRNDLILAVWVLASLICWINFLDDYHFRRFQSALWFGAHLIFFALALLTKELALVLPIVFFFYLRLLSREKITIRKWLMIILSWLALISVWWWLKKLAFTFGLSLVDQQVWRNFLTNLPAVLVYLGKMVLPVNLSVLPVLANSTKIYGLIVFLAILVLIWFNRRKLESQFWFGLVWFWLFLLPSLIWLDQRGSAFLALDHRIYLPLIGLIILLSGIKSIYSFSWRTKPQIITIVLILLIFASLTVWQSRKYQDRLTFWINAVKDSPDSALAHKNLGAMYYLDGFLNKAALEYNQALEINPQELMVNNNLALIYLRRGSLNLAEDKLLREIRINPGYDNAYFNLGLVKYNQGKKDEAKALWQQTLKINPNYPQVRELLNQ